MNAGKAAETIVEAKRLRRREYQREYQHKYQQTPKGKEADRKYAAQRREWMQREKLGRGCIDCGYNAHPAALDFDHVRGAKAFGVSRVKRSLAALKAEIEKCEVRCSNCHRIKTFEARQAAKDKRTIRG